MEQELFARAQIAYQQAQAHEERLGFINQQIQEMEEFNSGLKQLAHNKQGEILASLGKGVFVKTKRIEQDFFVDVGAQVFVKRNLSDIQMTLGEQINRLTELREEIKEELADLKQDLSEMMESVEPVQKHKTI